MEWRRENGTLGIKSLSVCWWRWKGQFKCKRQFLSVISPSLKRVSLRRKWQEVFWEAEMDCYRPISSQQVLHVDVSRHCTNAVLHNQNVVFFFSEIIFSCDIHSIAHEVQIPAYRPSSTVDDNRLWTSRQTQFEFKIGLWN